MHDHLTGPFWGNLVTIALAGGVTAACFIAVLRMLIRPGESDPQHPKYMVLDEKRQSGE